ncbi:MAG: hypothetical protein GYB37_15815, partial [Algicola sp.]|nr:hypothetical protein [Algicola sp.]
LVVLGGAIGYGLKFITSEKMQLDVIVRPNLDSKDYLYDVIDEIDVNLRSKNKTFFDDLEITLEEIKGFQVTIEPIKKDSEEGAENELEYLETLQKFQNTDLVADVLRDELLKKSELNHKISFIYTNPSGEVVAKKLIDFINSNDYFKELLAVHTENSITRIKQNEVLIAQIDTIIKGYSSNLNNETKSFQSDKLVLQNEESLNATELLTLKTDLIEDIENIRTRLKKVSSTVRVINFGKPHMVSKAFFGKRIILLPLVLVGLFLLFSFLKYINRKASQIEV